MTVPPTSHSNSL